MPDFRIVEWNEDNFDISQYIFAKEAYECRKYAFVADVARMHILLNHGGVYLDTDVEAIGTLAPFLETTAFTGFEFDDVVGSGIIGSEKGGEWVKDCLDYYNERHFIKKDGTLDIQPNVRYITDILVRHGLLKDDSLQDFNDYVKVYPKDYFCPKTYDDCKVHVTNNTVTIHHFAGSWKTIKTQRNRKVHDFLGDGLYSFLAKAKWTLIRLFKNK